MHAGMRAVESQLIQEALIKYCTALDLRSGVRLDNKY